ncbi:MAG TPA: SPOR domain-containing protein [Sphingomonas sp.]|uniref:SPOR domain-containing protein n=1 Tax=Sphingomonas sp. TaxID=28214 RepID=UPI002C15159A|nr:SPOR domain-containing protein [Sphingomonas sp.]HMI20163.1 SPOR domain-containing protein [Sphingomonas sp.]
MAEIRRGFGGEALGNERLPWLEPVEDEDDYPETGGGGGGRLALWIVIVLVALAILFGGFILWQRHRAASADIGEVIHAPAGPYKEKPANPGGLQVNEGDVLAAKMGTGTDIDSPIDLTRIPEQPVTRPGSDQSAAPAPAPAPVAARPGAPAAPPVATPAQPPKVPPHPALAYAPPTAASAPVVKAPPPAPVAKAPPVPAAPSAPASASGGSGTIQLGALGSEAKAKQVWKSLSTRFSTLAPLNMSITPVKVGDATLYRLRASGGDAKRLCAQLKVAGETCNVVD